LAGRADDLDIPDLKTAWASPSIRYDRCQEAGQVTLAGIADMFGLASYASAGSSIRRIRQRMEEEGGFTELVNYILLDLTP